jgi:hypothetical protein
VYWSCVCEMNVNSNLTIARDDQAPYELLVVRVTWSTALKLREMIVRAATNGSRGL